MTNITIPRTLLEEALVALEYHTQQTRPIKQTEDAIKNIIVELAKPTTHTCNDAPYVCCEQPECSCPLQEITELKSALDAAVKDAVRYRLLRRGQQWSVIDGVCDILLADFLDFEIDEAIAKAESSAS